MMWKNIIEPGRPQMTTWQMRIACWIPKATNAHSHYVILIVFPLIKWLHKHTSILRYICIHCLPCCFYWHLYLSWQNLGNVYWLALGTPSLHVPFTVVCRTCWFRKINWPLSLFALTLLSDVSSPCHLPDGTSYVWRRGKLFHNPPPPSWPQFFYNHCI